MAVLGKSVDEIENLRFFQVQPCFPRFLDPFPLIFVIKEIAVHIRAQRRFVRCNKLGPEVDKLTRQKKKNLKS